jgi:uncharacterized membrane protein
MTASKSSRARKARAQASAARTGTTARTGTAAGNGTAARNGVTAKTSVQVKSGSAAKTSGGGVTGSGTVRATSPARAADASRNGAGGNAQTRGGSRATVSRDELADAGAATGRTVPLWLQLTTFLLALAGLGVSIYLTIAHFTDSTLAGCSEKSGLVNCTKVTSSAQSYVFGIPVAVLGLAFFVFAVAIMSPWAWRSTRREVHLARLASVVVGVGFVIYLLYAELFIIGSICLYCTSVHVITFLLFVLTMFAAAAWGTTGLGPARQSS